ncbi:biliverdin-producing heme oxygenase [Pseudomonas sp. PB3P13]
MQSNGRSVGVSLVLQALRAETAPLHIALEERLPFFSPVLDLDHYQRLIQAYFGFYQPLERRLQDSHQAPPDFVLTERLKTATLHGDLLALGLTEREIAGLPLCRSLPVIDSAEACLGVFYVLEGATLGGQILRREIASRLNLDAANGAAFLDIYGDATGRRWRDFIGYLATFPLEPAARHCVVNAAQTTFACFENWLESSEVLL